MTPTSLYTKLLAFSTLLLSLSCGEEPQPIPKLCRLTTLTSTSLVTTVEYNSSGLASKVTAHAGTGKEFIVEIEYGDGRLSKINNGANSFDEFVYEGERLKEIRTMQRSGTSQPFTLSRTTTFEYDPTGQIVKAVFTGQGLPAYGTFYKRAVTSNGNTDKIFTTDHGTNSYGSERLEREVTRFDDKKSRDAAFPFVLSYFSGLNGLVAFSVSYRYFQTSNNPLEGKNYSSNGSASPFVIAWEYNEHGYPIKGTEAGYTAEMEYNCEDVQ